MIGCHKATQSEEFYHKTQVYVQLGFNADDVYSTVIYSLALKQIMDIIEFKTNWNQVVFWFTQMI